VDPKLQRRIQRYGWNKAAAEYEQSWQAQLGPAQSMLLEMAALRAGQSVLDVACGTGLVTFAAAAAVGPGGRVVGVDLSEEMVERARAQAVRLGVAHVGFERMDAEALDLPAASFDAAVCALGLMYVPDPREALGEMARVLAPGGRAVAAVWGERSRCGWAEVFPIVDARVRSEVCPLFFALGTADRLATMFRDAGLADVTAERLQTRLHWASAEEACGAAFVAGPVALAYSRFDETARFAVREAYLASIEPWREGSGYAVPAEFVIVAGVRPA